VKSKVALRVLLAAALGVGAALIVACGSSSSTKGLIPAASAGPLQGDVDAVEAAAGKGNGNCGPTEVALLKLDQDYAALPTTVNRGLNNTLRQGIDNLHKDALEVCAQPLAGTTGTTATTTTKTETTPTVSTETETTPVTPTPNPEETPGQRGGTPAPGENGGGETPEEGTPGGSGEGTPGGAGQEPEK
jgi:hypothetical protein